MGGARGEEERARGSEGEWDLDGGLDVLDEGKLSALVSKCHQHEVSEGSNTVWFVRAATQSGFLDDFYSMSRRPDVKMITRQCRVDTPGACPSCPLTPPPSQIADLFTLSRTKGLVNFLASPLSDFIVAQGRARSPSFARHSLICTAPPVAYIPSQPFAKFFTVEGELFR